MQTNTFLNYYLKALYKALENDHVNYGFLVKSPSWYYPEDNKDLYYELMTFEDTHYLEIPLLEKVGVYFDAKSHGFDKIDNIDINDYREKIIKGMIRLSEEYNISYK